MKALFHLLKVITGWEVAAVVSYLFGFSCSGSPPLYWQAHWCAEGQGLKDQNPDEVMVFWGKKGPEGFSGEGGDSFSCGYLLGRF